MISHCYRLSIDARMSPCRIDDFPFLIFSGCHLMAFLNAHIRITGSLLIEHLEENASNSCLCSTPVVITQLDSRHNVFRITELRG